MNSTDVTTKWIPYEFMPYVALNAVGIVIGVFGNLIFFKNFSIEFILRKKYYLLGNLLILAAILCTKKLRKAASSVILFSLSVAHLFISGFVNTFALIGFLCGELFFLERHGLCGFAATICTISSSVAFINICLLALDR